MSPTNNRSPEETLARQIRLLKDRQRARKFQDDVFTKIVGNRQRKNDYRIRKHDLNADEFVVTVEAEVLFIDDQAAAAADAVGTLTGAGFSKVPTLSPAPAKGSSLEKLSKRVARFRGSSQSGDAVTVARNLRLQNVQASVNYVLPLGYVAKGEGGFERASALPAPPATGPGTGVRVAVIDTGIGPKRNDGWLDGITRNQRTRDPLYQGPPEPPKLLDFAAGHGTFVTGIIQQVAPGAQITMYRSIGSDGIGTDVDVAAAILRAAQDDAQIINLSLGTPSLEAGDSPVATQEALRILAEDHDGVLVVASAGNSPTQSYYPAAFPRVQAVASLQANEAPSEWSSHGTNVAFSAVGEGIVSTYVVGDEPEELDKDQPDTFPNPSWALGTGTSFAAPQIVGKIAEVMTSEGRTATDACTELKKRGTKVTDYGTAMKILKGTARA